MAAKRSSNPSRSRSKKHASRNASPGKVGSDPQAAKQVGGKGDFGAPADDVRERTYVSQETKQNDPGAAPPRIKAGGIRDSGAGSNDSGPGSGSGGDLHTDIVGVGFEGNGIAQDGPDRTEGADITTKGGGEPFAAPGPKGHARDGPQHVPPVRGSTVDHGGGDISTSGEGTGAGAVTNLPSRDDDSFAGEVSDDEAAGADNSPSDNR